MRVFSLLMRMLEVTIPKFQGWSQVSGCEILFPSLLGEAIKIALKIVRRVGSFLGGFVFFFLHHVRQGSNDSVTH